VSTAQAGFTCALPAPLSAAAIARRFPQVTVYGDATRVAHGIAALATAHAGALTFCDLPVGAAALRATQASIVIVTRGAQGTQVDAPDQTLIATADVRALFIDLVECQLPGQARPAAPAPGVHASARVDASATVAPTACIGANVVIGARCIVGPGATLYADTHVGDGCTIGPHAVLGYVGLAYHDRSDGSRSFFPHLAGVRIGDRVDIGAQTCVCRGMLSHTVIGDDAKVGSLVYISHGVIVDARAWLSAGTAIAGHAHVQADSLLGIGAVVVDNVDLGRGAMVAGGSVVTRSVEAGSKLLGVPAQAVVSMRRFGPTPRD
jgi:UDP-3-O-[3-hydroxymyristoyl] glucosamine N-acyltransferase